MIAQSAGRRVGVGGNLTCRLPELRSKQSIPNSGHNRYTRTRESVGNPVCLQAVFECFEALSIHRRALNPFRGCLKDFRFVRFAGFVVPESFDFPAPFFRQPRRNGRKIRGRNMEVNPGRIFLPCFQPQWERSGHGRTE